MQSPLFIVFDEVILMGQSPDCFVLPLARYCRLRQGRDICARHGLSELMNGRGREMRGRNSFGYRRCSRLDWGQSGLDLQTTDLIPAGVINPEIGVFLWSKSTLQTHGRELGGCTAFGISDCSACLQHMSTFFPNLSAKEDGRYRMPVPKYCHQIQ